MVDISTDDARGGRETRRHKVTKMLIVSLILTFVALMLAFQFSG